MQFGQDCEVVKLPSWYHVFVELIKNLAYYIYVNAIMTYMKMIKRNRLLRTIVLRTDSYYLCQHKEI